VPTRFWKRARDTSFLDGRSTDSLTVDLPRFGGRVRSWVMVSEVYGFCPLLSVVPLFGSLRARSFVPARASLRPSRAGAVKAEREPRS
jgi:hypothetical protein